MPQVLADVVHAPEGASLRKAAEEHLRAMRWREAAETLEKVEGRDVACEFQLRLARNMAAMKGHRPGVYEAIITARGGRKYSIGAGADGRPTVFITSDQGSQVCLSAGGDPRGSMAAAMSHLHDAMVRGLPVALHGAGDGYLLNALAVNARKLELGREQSVYLIEPDAQALMTCMMMHDYSASNGPIAAERFHWFVGQGWREEARRWFIDDLFNLFPSHSVNQGVEAFADAADGPLTLPAPLSTGARVRPIEAGMQAIVEELAKVYQELKRRVDEHYGRMSAADFAAAFAGRSGRRARVLVVTTRFSSVLQYSARDVAEGFERNGWETRVFIEPHAWQCITLPAIREYVAEFKPDLVFQLDHLRHELKDTFPPQAPFACWAQDHLANLTSRSAGGSVGPRDFVLTGLPGLYIERWGYPTRQIIEISKLTRVPQRPVNWRSDGDDLAYVSSASRRPEEIVLEVEEQFAPAGADLRELAAACCREVMRVYESGGAMPTFYEVRLLVEAVEKKVGANGGASPTLQQKLIDILFDRLANVMYRQQGLRWAAGVARKRGLTLAIYGPGWEKNPEFAAHARGPVKYGPDLEELTRRSRINFVLEPYYCISHQRLLDGLAAGGFFLIREHPTNRLFPELLNFVCDGVDGEARSVEEARERVRPDRRAELERLLEKCACLFDFGDPVDLVRRAEGAGTLRRGQVVLPELERVSFVDERTLDACVMRFAGDERARREISQRQRGIVEENLSYAGGMRRIAERIGRLLAEEGAGQVSASSVVAGESKVGQAHGSR